MFNQLQLADINLIWLIAIAILLLALFLFIFNKDKFGKASLGMSKSIGFIFSSPFVYFKKCFVNLNQLGENESDDLKTNQYLLSKLLLILEIFLILFSVIFLSSGIIRSWNGFLPPLYLREEISSNEKYISNAQDQLDSLKTVVKNYDDSWAQQKDKLISDYKNDEQNQKNSAMKNNSQIETQFASAPQFNILKTFLIQNNSNNNVYSLNNVNQNATSWINMNVNEMNLRSALLNYLNNWIIVKTADRELNNFSEDQIRNNVQPNYAMVNNRVNYLAQDIQNVTQNLTSLRAQVKYNITFLFESLLITILQFMLYIWVIGLAIEILFLSLDVATNVRKIKMYLYNKN